MSDRKFASVQVITAMNPIDGYDKVEMATVLGWSCIVQKGQFKVGDRVIYIEVDSKMPPRKEYDFLEKRNWKVKTLKMCKTISQGLILPLDVLPDIWKKKKAKEGMDLTKDFGITHIDEEKEDTNVKKSFLERLWKRILWKFFKIKLKNKMSKTFPKHLVSKTDEPNVQTIGIELRKRLEDGCIVTEKLEGQSATYGLQITRKWFMKAFKFIVCSHHVLYPKKTNNNWWNVGLQFDIENKLIELYKRTGNLFIIQGEIIGTGIQRNIYKIAGFDFYVFNVKNLTTGETLNFADMLLLMNSIGLKVVPLLDRLRFGHYDLEDWLNYADGTSVINRKTRREGVVVREENGTFSFKCKSREYQLWFEKGEKNEQERKD